MSVKGPVIFQDGTIQKTAATGGGSGDMTKAVYDPNTDGKIAEAQLLLSYATHSNSNDHAPGSDNQDLSGKENVGVAAGLDHSNANDPSAGQKLALVGTSGTPGTDNKFVTNADSRNTDARTPTSHNHSENILHSLATAVSDFLVASGAGVFVKKTLAEVKTLLDWATDIATHAGLSASHGRTNIDGVTERDNAISTHAGLTTGVHGVGASTVETVAGSQAKVDSRLSAANATDLTDGGATTLHSHAGGGGGISTLKKTADQIINGTAFQNITDLVFNVVANTDYAFKFYIVFRSAATTTGFRFGVLAPSGAVLDFFMTYQTIANATTVGVATWLQGHWVSGEAMTALTATIALGVDLVCMIEGRVKVGATAGTLAARVASELANNDLVVQKGSWGTYF